MHTRIRLSYLHFSALAVFGLLLGAPSIAKPSWFCLQEPRIGLRVPIDPNRMDVSLALRPLFPMDLVALSPAATLRRESSRHALLVINGYSHRCQPPWDPLPPSCTFPRQRKPPHGM
jgi:hypothetical protein